MKDREPKECVICGTQFIPFRKNIKTCSNPECKKKLKNIQQRKWYKENYTHALETRREQVQRLREEYVLEEPHQRKPDTIVAIGYADRQRANTLAMVGKVNTEL